MLPELEEIKKKRKLFGMTQADLAAECGVSQSLIAKLESGKIVPAYGKAKKIRLTDWILEKSEKKD